MSKKIDLTEEQLKTITYYYDKGDRGRGHLELSLATGFPIADDMLKVSQFSGYLGGMAKTANSLAEEFAPNYHPKGVETFSKDIAMSVNSYLKDKNGQGLSDLEITQVVQGEWGKHGIAEDYPGNPLLFWKQTQENVNNLFSRGTLYSLMSAVYPQGMKLEDFTLSEDASNYKIQYTPDFSTRYVIENSGEKNLIFSEKTGAVFDKKSGDYVYEFTSHGVAVDKNKLARKLQISTEQIVYMDNSRLQGYGLESYKIIFKSTDKTPNIKIKTEHKESSDIPTISKKEQSKSTATKPVKSSVAPQQDNNKEEVLGVEKENNNLNKESLEWLSNTFTALSDIINNVAIVTENKNIQKVAVGVGSAGSVALGASTYMGAAALGGATAGLAMASGIGMAAVGVYSIANLIVNKGDNKENPFVKQLYNIERGVYTIIQEQREGFNQASKERIMIFNLNYEQYLNTVAKLDLILKYNEIGFRKLAEMGLFTILYSAEKESSNIKTGNLPFDVQGYLSAFNSFKDVALTAAKSSVFNGYNYNDNIEAYLDRQALLRETPEGEIAFLVDYARDVFKINNLHKGEGITNPFVFYKAAKNLIDLNIKVCKNKKELITPEVSSYIKSFLDVLDKASDEITETMIIFKTEVVSAYIKEYIKQINELGRFIQVKAQEYSDNKDITGLKGEYSLLSPDYETLRVQEHEIEYGRGGDHRCHLKVHLKYVRRDDIHFSDEGWTVEKKESGYCHDGIKANYGMHPYEKAAEAVNLKYIYYIENDLPKERIDCYDSIRNQEDYKRHLNKLISFDVLGIGIFNLLGIKFTLNARQIESNHFEALASISPKKTVDPSFNIKVEVPELLKLQKQYSEIKEDSTKLITQYETSGEMYKSGSNLIRKELDSLELNTSILKLEKVQKAYKHLLSMHKGIAEQLDDIKLTLAKPEQAKKLEELADYLVNIEFVFPSIIDNTALKQLEKYQCGIFCIDRYAQSYDSGYRAFMQHDQSMEIVIDIIKDLPIVGLSSCDCNNLVSSTESYS